MKKHPVTGEDVPDDSARIAVMEFVNPRRASWPDADFIVGNPPFIGKLRVVRDLGEGYAAALREAYAGDVPDSVDFVMYWWFKAAELVRLKQARRFGFVTTHAIHQTFNRRVVETALDRSDGPRLLYAIPDHPWVDTADAAAVRIAMSVVGWEDQPGVLDRVVSEDDANADTPIVSFERATGTITPDFRIGANATGVLDLAANNGLTSNGVMLGGRGFLVDRESPVAKGLRVSPVLNSNDVVQTSRRSLVIDFYGQGSHEAREASPAAFQQLVDRVKPERDHNRRASYRNNWWIFSEPRAQVRALLLGLASYIATPETSKHRVFVKVPAGTIPEHPLIAFGIGDSWILGVLSSRVHVTWALRTGGRLGVGNDPRYNKTRCFDPFPFPAATDAQKARIRELGESLDAHRKRQQAQHPSLTLTGMYNVLEKLRSAERSRRRSRRSTPTGSSRC